MHFAQRSPLSGVFSLGLKMTVLPATRLGMTTSCAIHTGKFQGVMQTETPSGSKRNCDCTFPSSSVSCSSAFAFSLTNSTRIAAQPFASPIPSSKGFPISRLMSAPISSARASISTAADLIACARALSPIAAQPTCAARDRATTCGIS